MRSDVINRAKHTAEAQRFVLRLSVVAALLISSLFADAAFADSADLGDTPSQLTRHRAVRPLEQLCVGPGSNAECAASFAAALKSAETTPELVVAATSLQPAVGLRGATPLRFQKRAPWVRRLETLGKEGLPFVRVPRGPDNELVIGINRKGVLGFQLKQVPRR
jgi:hypothetical protein